MCDIFTPKNAKMLNDAQKTAVEATEGPLLVLAGAGAGKTKTITHRILNLIKKGVAPENILAVTFTNKAAAEMKERLESLLKESPEINRPISMSGKPFVGTFHSLCVKIIKENAKILSAKRHFSIYDRSDSKKAIKESFKQLGLNEKEFDPGKVLSIISREKGNLVSKEEFAAREGSEFYGGVVARTWAKYEAILKKENAYDFDDLLVVAANLLQSNEQVKNYYLKIWRYIHIDEYQDTNEVQYKIAKLLSGENHNICVVGDIDQNIYSWRGANIRNILNFEKDYSGAKLVVLEENYRSTQTILAVANRIIEKNKLRRKKVLFTANALGEKMGLFEALDESQEAAYVAEKVKIFQKKGMPLSEIAVLYRANFQSRALEEACLKAGVPYQVVGTRFFERKEIKDVISFIRYALNPESTADLARIINAPPRGIGKVTLLKMVEGKEEGLPIKIKEKVFYFRKTMVKIKESALIKKPSATVKFVIEVTGLGEALSKSEPARHAGQAGGEEIERVENLKELIAFAARYDTDLGEDGIENFLSEVALVSDQDAMKDEERVRLMTVHASKGLEFETVFITGLEEGLFPSDKDRDREVSAEEAEEERRLFYVALTRAKKKLFLTYAQSRAIYGSRGINIPSEFIFDIPEEYIEREYFDYIPKRKPLLDIQF